MDQIQEQENQRKTIAVMICLFVAFMYFETVWKPYFYGPLYTPSAGSTSSEQSGTVAPSPSASPTDTAASFIENPSPVATVTGGDPSVAKAVPGKYPSDAKVAEKGFVTVSNSDLKLKVSLLGGRLTEGLLLKYPVSAESPDTPLDIVFHAEHAPYPLGVYSGGVNDAWTEYRVISGAPSGSISLADNSAPQELVLEGQLPDGRTITKRFEFQPEGYLVKVAIALSGPPADASRASLEWTKLVEDFESSTLNPYETKGYTWFDGEKANREAYDSLEGEKKELGEIRWVSQGDKYFMAAIIAPGVPTPGYALRTGTLWRSRLSGGPSSAEFEIVMGPKEYERLSDFGGEKSYELQRNIDFGYTGFIAAPLLSLLHVAYSIVGNYGLAIVFLTVLVRLALYPLAAASFKQMRAMQDLKPEIDRVREQVKDKQQQQMELMNLYKKKGVNPLGGCLPVVLQMPIFIGLYSALMLSVELRNAPFALWITDLSAPESLIIAGVGIPVMVILFVLSMMAQQWTTPSTMDPAQKKVMMVMPIAFGFMFMNFPAGLTLYWLTSNLISIGQQKAMHAQNAKASSALKVTMAVSATVFAFAYVLTLIG